MEEIRVMMSQIRRIMVILVVLSAVSCIRGGGRSGPAGPEIVYDSSTALFTFFGRAGDNMGASVSGAGDVNRDGFADVIIGAPLDDTFSVDAGCAHVYSGKTGLMLYTFFGDTTMDNFGASVSGAGDVNKDGHDDIIVGSVMDDKNGINSGSAFLFSGLDGKVLSTFTGEGVNDRLGNSVSSAGDVNKDGHADVIVGAWLNDGSGVDAGMARIHSGKDYQILHTFRGDSPRDNFGYAVSGVGDVDKDGHDDVVVGAWKDDNVGKDSGSATVFSGKDGHVLYRFNGDSAGDAFGAAVSSAGDVNKDGYPDIIVGARWDSKRGGTSGSAFVFSGKDGRVLHTFIGDAAADNLGISVSGAGDVDGDGHADVLVGAQGDDNFGLESGSARLFSGKTGGVLFGYYGDDAGDSFGYAVSGAGDVNKDGCPDIIIGARWDDLGGYGSGTARIYSGKNLGLASETYALSLSSNGSQKFNLDAGIPMAGKDYILLGTLAGTEPGILVGHLIMPLNLDAYFLYTLVNPNVPPLSNSMGQLDSRGKGTAAFTMPKGLPVTLAGYTMHHAFGILVPKVEYISNAVPLTFLL